jgi:hypothetical protein
VEAGVDFSFRTAFRESWGLVNLLQIAGRAAHAGIADRRFQIANADLLTQSKNQNHRFQIVNRKS